MKYFIASSWTNMKQVQPLTENLSALGHEVFHTVPDERNFVPAKELPRPAKIFEDISGWQKNPELRKLFEEQLTGIQNSDVVILLLPAGRSSHIAAGIGYGLGKHLVLIGELDRVKLNYFVFDEWHKTIEAYLASMKK